MASHINLKLEIEPPIPSNVSPEETDTASPVKPDARNFTNSADYYSAMAVYKEERQLHLAPRFAGCLRLDVDQNGITSLTAEKCPVQDCTVYLRQKSMLAEVDACPNYL